MVTTAADLRRRPKLSDSAQRAAGTTPRIIRNAGAGRSSRWWPAGSTSSIVGVSPDGRWISFVSDQSGRDEVYVRDLAGERDQVLVSLDGGNEPVWSPDGRELYLSRDEAGRPLSGRGRHRDQRRRSAVTSRTRLFPVGDIVGTGPHANYDVSPDGKTFAMVRRSPAGADRGHPEPAGAGAAASGRARGVAVSAIERL